MNVKEIIKNATLEEKAGLLSGLDFWHTKPIERLGVPSVMVSDGPHGLRKQADDADHLGINDSIEAVCFPAACATACTFDREMMQEMGEVLGKECQAENVSILLGPAVNIKRSPLCGRNFEYISEDPYLAGELAAHYIEGVQSQNVGTSVKHFAANNQEHERMSGSSEIEERTLREIYLPAFEIAVKKSQPYTIMCSYNKLNGIFASEHKGLLHDILRDEWGFEGYVMSDWGAVSDRVAGVIAGMDLEMPGSHGTNDIEIVKAVREGRLEEAVVDRAAERILEKIKHYVENKKQGSLFDREKDHQKAIEIAKKCIVLLKNDAILPLDNVEGKIVFIGEFAEKPRYQGGGSSHINTKNISNVIDGAKKFGNIVYKKGFSRDADIVEETLMAEALEAAKTAEKVVIFAGLPDIFESEGYDRSHMRLPECQNELIQKICEVQDNVVVVLQNGSPVEMPWINQVKGIVEAYLGGEGIGEAIASVLFGETNPCGKLAESFPIRLEDNPSYLNFGGKNQLVPYAEGIFVGYRYYDTKNMDVLFPFGHGLSYTQFTYSNLILSQKEMTDKDSLTVSVTIQNSGDRDGKEVVQLYVTDESGATVRPTKELKNFAAVTLKAGEKKTITMELDKRAFAWYNTEIQDWYAASGTYEILIGKSSRDIVLQDTIKVQSTTVLKKKIDKDVTLGELFANEKTKEYTKKTIMPYNEMFTAGNNEDMQEMMEAMAKYMPLRALRSFSKMTNEDMNKIVKELNDLLQN